MVINHRVLSLWLSFCHINSSNISLKNLPKWFLNTKKKTESKTLPAFSGAPIDVEYSILPQYFQVTLQPLV